MNTTSNGKVQSMHANTASSVAYRLILITASWLINSVKEKSSSCYVCF